MEGLATNFGGVVMKHFDRLGVVPLLGAMVPLLDAMVRCSCWVHMVRCHGKVPFDRVPLLGAMCGRVVMTHFGRLAWCHCWMLGMVPLLGAIAGCRVPPMVRCHCRVPCGRVRSLDAIDGCHLVGCHCWMPW